MRPGCSASSSASAAGSSTRCAPAGVATGRACPRINREILLLRDLEGRSIAGIAEHLGLHVEAEKARLHHARLLAREYGSSDAPDAPSNVHATG
jgi:hypothetical protein